MIESPDTRTEALMWDWREQIDLDNLAAAVDRVTNGTVRLYQVDTGRDDYGIVLSTNTDIPADAVADTFEATLDAAEEAARNGHTTL